MPIVYFFYPETSNMSLEDIDKIFLPRDQWDTSSMEEGSVGAEEVKGAEQIVEKV